MLSVDITIRKADSEEQEKVIEFFDTHLHNMYHDPGFLPAGMLRDKIGRGNVIVADSEDGILAAAVTNGITLWNLVVHRDYRNNGIGTALLRSVDPQYVRIKCSGGIPDPTDFYMKNGYRPVGLVPSSATKKKTILLAERIGEE